MKQNNNAEISEFVGGIATIAILLVLFLGYIFPAACKAGVKLLCGL
jgi:hypothetical protein